MAVQWADNFSRYGTGTSGRTAMLDGLVYAELSGNTRPISDPDPEVEGVALNIGALGTSFNRDFRVALPSVISSPTDTELGVLFRAWLTALPDGTSTRQVLFAARGSTNGTVFNVRVEPNGALSVYDSNDDLIATTTNPVVSTNSWIHYELVHDIATGEGAVYVNGVSRLSWTNLEVGVSIHLVSVSPRSGNSNPNSDMFIKDFIVRDGSGSQNNTVMGTVIVGRLKPNSDISLGGWTPSTGSTGFNLLAKDEPNDATFLSADDSPPAEMVFGFEDLPPDVTSVRALITVSRQRKVDGGDGNIQTAVSPDGTDWDNGEDRPITTAFQYDFDVSEINPATASPWTPVAVDSIQGRVDRTV